MEVFLNLSKGFLSGRLHQRSGRNYDMRNSQDRNRVSNEPYEIEYIHRHFPNRSHQEVEKAIRQAKSQMGGSEDREKLMQILNQTLK